LFSAQVGNHEAYFYMLLAHRSDADRFMPLRLLQSVVRVLERHVESKSAEEALPLPLVIPVVLHHSDAGWASARRFEDLFDSDLLGRAGVRELVPRLGFAVDDLSHLTDDELATRALRLMTLTMGAIRDAPSSGRAGRGVLHWVRAMERLVGAPNRIEALQTLSHCIALVANDSVASTVAHATPDANPELKNALTTFAEKLTAESEAKGEGKALRKILTLKFGELDQAALARLDAAKPGDMDRWLGRVLTADTIETVLEG